MGLKTKYQYTDFIYPYIIDNKKYDKYILNLLKDKRCEFKIFEKEKDMNIYNYFLPHIRNYIFPTFELRGEYLKNFRNMNLDLKSKIIAKQACSCFDLQMPKEANNKIKEGTISYNIEKVEIICFNTGICFMVIRTTIENSNDFSDVLNFNYKFKDINSKLNHLKNFDNIKIQPINFKDNKVITTMIEDLSSYKRKVDGATEELTNSRFLTFAYTCVERESWNNNLELNQMEYNRYANVLPINYSYDLENDSKNGDAAIINKYKYYKIAIAKMSSNLICSGIDPYNYTKLYYEYETEFLYTYIIMLYQKIFLRKVNSDFRQYSKLSNIREEFIEFTKHFWNKETTLSEIGTNYIKTLKKVLDLEELYDEIKSKYEIIYKDLNIEKNNKYFTITMLLLIFSLTFNTVNIVLLMYLIT